MSQYTDTVMHLKKKLDKGVSFEKTLHILHKLQKISISIDLLEKTGIGKTVRNLSKQHTDTDIGKTAKVLCISWKAAVKEEQTRHDQHLDDDHHHEDSDDQPIRTPNCDIDNTFDYQIKSNSGSESEESVANHKRKSSSDRRSDKKHRRSHKSSHKSRDSEPPPKKTTSNGVKTEFESLLGLNDEMVVKNSSHKHKSSSSASKRSDSGDRFTKLKANTSSNDTNSKSHNKRVKSEKVESDYRPKSVDSFGVKHSDILSSLPTSDYKPLPNREIIDERVEAANRRKVVKPNDKLSLNVQSKKGRTAVFAGQARTRTYTHVHKLEDLCLSVLGDNINKIEYLDDAPYYLLKPVLQKCSSQQLSRIERLNPQIVDETDELWKEFCKKEFRGKDPDSDDDESWRDLYLRCGKEREDRLKNITKSISHKQSKALPVRQTQFSENVKTSREILRKQERSGVSQSYSSSGSAGHTSNYVKIVPEKPKVAPLMRKALKLQRAGYRK